MYILFTGAPGSKWSSVVKKIYWSEDLDHSDYSEARTYYHDADTPGNKHLMHIGAYWDPGMEFENNNWDGPFSGTGRRIIKSHTFATELNRLKTLQYPIVMVYRNDYECLKWWQLCGAFDISYPNYQYFENLNTMWRHIQQQNKCIMDFVKDNDKRITQAYDNLDLCNILGIAYPNPLETHYYAKKDIKVYVYK